MGSDALRSVRPLANDIAMRGVVTNPHFSRRVSCNSAADELSAPPNNLRIVATTGSATICLVIVIGRFGSPGAHDLVGVFVASHDFEKILAKEAVAMRRVHPGIDQLYRPRLGSGRQLLRPRKWRGPNPTSIEIMRRDHRLRHCVTSVGGEDRQRNGQK